MAVLPRHIYRCNIAPVRMPSVLSVEIDKLSLSQSLGGAAMASRKNVDVW